MSTESNRIFLAFWRGLPVEVAESLNSRHVQEAIAKAETHGWRAPASTPTLARRDTHGLKPGAAAAKIIGQLRELAEQDCPDRTSQPPPVAEVWADINRGHQPASDTAKYVQQIRQALGETA